MVSLSVRTRAPGQNLWRKNLVGTNRDKHDPKVESLLNDKWIKGKVSENVANFNASVGLSHWLQSSALDAALCGILQPQHPHFKTYL